MHQPRPFSSSSSNTTTAVTATSCTYHRYHYRHPPSAPPNTATLAQAPDGSEQLGWQALLHGAGRRVNGVLSAAARSDLGRTLQHWRLSAMIEFHTGDLAHTISHIGATQAAQPPDAVSPLMPPPPAPPPRPSPPSPSSHPARHSQPRRSYHLSESTSSRNFFADSIVSVSLCSGRDAHDSRGAGFGAGSCSEDSLTRTRPR